MQNPAALIFFVLFAIVQVAMYILVRRGIGSMVTVAIIGIAASIVCVMLMTLAQGNTILWAIVLGVLLSGLFSTVALAAAWYFSTSDKRRAKFDPHAPVEVEEIA